MMLLIILLFVVRNHYIAYPGKITPSELTYDKNIVYDLQSIPYVTCYTHSVVSRWVARRRYITRVLYLSGVVCYTQHKHKHTKIK